MSLSEKAVVVVRLQPIMATSTSYRQFFVVIMHAFKVIDFFFFSVFQVAVLNRSVFSMKDDFGLQLPVE